MMNSAIVERLRKPAYTGENRCLPCTVVNLVIAAVVTAAVTRKTKRGGLAVGAIAVALIYLRGYLIPGTPTLTKRYLPPEVLAWFGKEPDLEVHSGLEGGVHSTSNTRDEQQRTATETPAIDTTQSAAGEQSTDTPAATEHLEAYLTAHDVLEPCAEEDDLCLTDAFETAWFDAIEPLTQTDTVDPTTAAHAFGFDDDSEYELETYEEARLLRADGIRLGQWPSRAALIADVACSQTLETWVPDWDSYEPATKGEILNGLRVFLETCPTAGGAVRMDEETVESCCSSHEVVAVYCEGTGERLFEHRLADIEA